MDEFTGKVIYKRRGNCICCASEEHIYSKHIAIKDFKDYQDFFESWLKKNPQAEGKDVEITIKIMEG